MDPSTVNHRGLPTVFQDLQVGLRQAQGFILGPNSGCTIQLLVLVRNAVRLVFDLLAGHIEVADGSRKLQKLWPRGGFFDPCPLEGRRQRVMGQAYQDVANIAEAELEALLIFVKVSSSLSLTPHKQKLTGLIPRVDTKFCFLNGFYRLSIKHCGKNPSGVNMKEFIFCEVLTVMRHRGPWSLVAVVPGSRYHTLRLNNYIT